MKRTTYKIDTQRVIKFLHCSTIVIVIINIIIILFLLLLLLLLLLFLFLLLWLFVLFPGHGVPISFSSHPYVLISITQLIKLLFLIKSEKMH